MRAIDARLFTGTFAALDAANRKVPGVVAASLGDALALVGNGMVATVFGTLGEDYRAVDIDLTGVNGYLAAELVARWATRNRRWHLVRPSGGADGRAHVFVHVPTSEARDQLEHWVAGLRADYGWSTSSVDVRRFMRPLSAPHRTGCHTRPDGDLRALLRSMPKRTPSATAARAKSSPRAHVTATVPRRRIPRPMPAEWQAYLDSGAKPRIGGKDQSASTFEAICTLHMVHAGYTADAAWAAIQASHKTAFTKAKANRRRWVSWVWNPAVADADRRQPRTDADPTLLRMIAAARCALTNHLWTLTPRQRPAVATVGHAVLDLAERVHSDRVGVAEREIVLATGISDRKTIRAALRGLDGVIGRLDTTQYRREEAARSSFEFVVDAPEPPAVSIIPPLSSHTPAPAGTHWRTLPRACPTLWRTLDPATGQSLPELCHAAALTATRTSSPSPRQLRTARAALTALASIGLAACDANGQWRRLATPPALLDNSHLEVSVRAERDSFHQGSYSAWKTEQARVLRANRARTDAWWSQLSAAERARRRARWRRTFDALPLTKQEQVKTVMAVRRSRYGVDETERHAAWRASMPSHEYLDRCTERVLRYEALPPPLQAASVASWKRHRRQFGMPPGPTCRTANPATAATARPGPQSNPASLPLIHPALAG